jgi:hypothetical protein
MRKAYDIKLSDYVDAESAAKNGGFEPYRYECACCWEEVLLYAAESPYFRHRNGNNNVECENYLGIRGVVIDNARSRKNLRDKIDFYFSSDTKMFSVKVKFNEEEITKHEKNRASFHVKSKQNAIPFTSIPVDSTYFLPGISEFIPLTEFSWEYYISFASDAKQQRYEVFCKDKKGFLYPSFFKIQSDKYNEEFTAKLVRTDKLYTNTLYLVIFPYSYNAVLDFRNDVKVDKVIEFKTMNREFVGIIVTFINKTVGIEQQLNQWKYTLETNENVTLLWPPTSQYDDQNIINKEYAYIFSSFEMQAHGNINVRSKNITNLGNGITKIIIDEQAKIYKKNVELSLTSKLDDIDSHKYDIISLKRESTRSVVAPDGETYFFNRSGVFQINKGASVLLPVSSEVRHYSFGYLDCIIFAEKKIAGDNEQILKDILMYYRREEDFDYNDFTRFVFSPAALKYIKLCQKTGKINSAAKRFIMEGRI